MALRVQVCHRKGFAVLETLTRLRVVWLLIFIFFQADVCVEITFRRAGLYCVRHQQSLPWLPNTSSISLPLLDDRGTCEP